MQNFLESDSAQALLHLHLPRYEELPILDLYMEQMISIINENLAPLWPKNSGPILTPAMVNNYVKLRLVHPPVKKRYSRDHVAYFIVVALLKPVFSISEISALIHRQAQLTTVEAAYNRFCQELELRISDVMAGKASVSPLPLNGEAELLRAAVMSLANKVYVEKYLEFSEQ